LPSSCSEASADSLGSNTDAWLAAVDRDSETLWAYDDRLSGRVTAVDRFREVTLPMWLSDPLGMIGSRFATLDTLVFTVEPSALDMCMEACGSALKRLADRLFHREPDSLWQNGRARRRGKVRYRRSLLR
jgi:hypothetical protein